MVEPWYEEAKGIWEYRLQDRTLLNSGIVEKLADKDHPLHGRETDLPLAVVEISVHYFPEDVASAWKCQTVEEQRHSLIQYQHPLQSSYHHFPSMVSDCNEANYGLCNMGCLTLQKVPQLGNGQIFLDPDQETQVFSGCFAQHLRINNKNHPMAL